MKKLLSLVLCLVMVLAAIPAMAEDAYKPGDEVKISVDVAAANGAIIAKIRVSADDGGLEFVGAEASLSGVAPNKNGGAFVVYSSDLTSPLSGTVGTVTFKVKDDAADGDYEILVSCVDGSDTNYGTATCSVTGSTTVKVKAQTEEPPVSDRVPGDANEDGSVNTADALVIMQKIAGYPGITLNESNADCNRDGSVNTADALRIMQKIAGYPGVTLE